MNLGTKTVLVGAGMYGVRKAWEYYGEGQVAERPAQAEVEDEPIEVPFSKSMLGQSVCATVSGWFQVYSGGIAIDTVATRLQAGQPINQALWGLARPKTNGVILVGKFSNISGMSALQIRAKMLLRSNLFAGHFVTMISRFPYLFLNFNTYEQTDRLLAQYGSRANASSTAVRPWTDEVICVASATTISSIAITIAECPKIVDQVKPPDCSKGPETVQGIWRREGFGRLMQGYSACFGRELLFNTALLASPAIARMVEATYTRPTIESGNASAFAHALQGNELLVSSLTLGLGLGFLTNGFDQLKTRIQAGQFRTLGEAWLWQELYGGGLSGLYGKAAVYRAIFIGHAVCAINFARSHVEAALEDE